MSSAADDRHATPAADSAGRDDPAGATTPARLDGPWLAAPADDDRRAEVLDAGPDDPAEAGWALTRVPGHWRSTPGLEDHDDPVLYRTRFETPAAADDAADHPAGGPASRRTFLVLDGVFYTSDLWLDGTYLGDTEGYFFPHTFEVTAQLAAASEHLLVAEVACAPQRDRTKKRNLTGVLQHWDCIDPDWNPGGIWRPVHLRETGPVCIRHFRALCRDATDAAATVALRAVLDADAATTATLRTRVAGVEHRAEHPIAVGENRIEWTVTVDRPELWWPHALGEPTMHDLEVAVFVDGDGDDTPCSDRRRTRIGLRSVAMADWITSVNGERLFLKGTNLGPTRAALAEADGAEVAADVHLARDAGLDLVRVHGHVARPELYDAADDAGMLIWQDLPLQWGYARSVRRQARRQAREAVDLLAQHPSVAIWCGHNEPLAIDTDPAVVATPAGRRSVALRAAVGTVLPSWNRSVLDLAVRRVLRDSDPSRPVVAHSGVWPHPPQLDGTDSHLYFGWYHGEAGDLPGFAARWPRMVRFVSEFGAQSVPTDAGFCEPERWPDLDWERLARTHGLQRWAFDHHVPPTDHDDFDSWAEATRAYQAHLVRLQIEALRRLKYRPTGGFAHFLLADNHPAVSWSALDHRRVPKPAYEALARACAPVVVVADPLPPTVAPHQPLALEVHAVSDRRIDLERMEATARLIDDDGDGPTWRWTGDLPADSCVRIGRVTGVAPAAGGLRLELQLRGGGVDVESCYRATVAPPGTIGA